MFKIKAQLEIDDTSVLGALTKTDVNDLVRWAMHRAAWAWLKAMFPQRFTPRVHGPPWNYPDFHNSPLVDSGALRSAMLRTGRVSTTSRRGMATADVRFTAPPQLHAKPRMPNRGNQRVPKALVHYIRMVSPQELSMVSDHFKRNVMRHLTGRGFTPAQRAMFRGAGRGRR